MDSVSKSKRLVDSPACLVLAEHDMGLHMRRIMASAGRSITSVKTSVGSEFGPYSSEAHGWRAG